MLVKQEFYFKQSNYQTKGLKNAVILRNASFMPYFRYLRLIGERGRFNSKWLKIEGKEKDDFYDL